MKLSGFEEVSKELGFNLNFFLLERLEEWKGGKQRYRTLSRSFILGFEGDVSTEGRIELEKYIKNILSMVFIMS